MLVGRREKNKHKFQTKCSTIDTNPIAFKKSIIWLFCDLRFKRVSIADIGDKIYDDEKSTNQSLKQKI